MAVRERRNALSEIMNRNWSQMSDIIEGAAGANRDITPEERTRYEQLEAELDASKREYDRLAAHEERASLLAQPQRNVRLLPGGDRAVDPAQGRAVGAEEYEAAHRAYIRRGLLNMTEEQRSALQAGYSQLTPEEARALTVTTTAGGYLIPQGFERQLVLSRLQFGGMRQARTRKFTTDSGNDWPIPTMNDNTNKGYLLTINTAAVAQDVAFGQKTLKAYVMHSKYVLVPWQLLQDSAFDVEGEILAPAFGERIGRIENDYFTTGAGSTEPQGVITGASSGYTGLGAAASGPGYTDVVKLFHSVDPAYRGSAQFMCNDTTVSLMRLVVDDNNRPIWLPAASGGLAEPTPMTLLGKELIINQSMADPAANAKPLAFGDFSYYWIRDVKGVQVVRLEELNALSLQTTFFAWARVDGQLIDPGTDPIKYLTSAAA
jgi:HK97 family phage major capsid protein